MKLPLYQIDAFTSRMFGGNPAAVVLLDAWLPDDVLKAIAAENNLAETAFVVPHGEAMPLRDERGGGRGRGCERQRIRRGSRPEAIGETRQDYPGLTNHPVACGD